MSQKELVRKLLRGRELSRPPFIPLMGTYLTKVDQISVEELLAEPGALFSGLIHTQQLFGLDAVSLPVDLVLEAEAFGVSIRWEGMKMPAAADRMERGYQIHFHEATWLRQGRIPVYLEAVKRFVSVHGKSIPLFATINGPMTVLQQLYGDEAIPLVMEEDANMLAALENISQASIALCKSYGELKVDGVIIYEDAPLDAIVPEVLERYYKPLFTVLRFYNTAGLFRVPPGCRMWPNVQSDGIFVPEKGSVMPDFQSFRGVKGISLSISDWPEDGNLDDLRYQFQRNDKKSFFLSTLEPLHADIDMNLVQTCVALLCAEGVWTR